MTTLIEKIKAEIDRAAKEYHKSGFVKSSHVHEANSFYDGALFLLPLLKRAIESVDDWALAGNIENYSMLSDKIENELLKLIGCEHDRT